MEMIPDNDGHDDIEEHGHGDEEIDLPSFESVIQALTLKGGASNTKNINNTKSMRDPRALRLAAVTAAVVELAQINRTPTTNANNLTQSEEDMGDDNNNEERQRQQADGPLQQPLSASQVYAKAVTALEGTLSSEQQKQQYHEGQNIHDSLYTQVALLELLSQTLPYVENTAFLRATLPVTSRVLRALVSVSQTDVASNLETKDELGGINALLRACCKATRDLLARLPLDTDHAAVQQLYLNTLVRLWDDRRPKVRKAAQNAAVELICRNPSASPVHPVLRKATSKYFQSSLTQTRKGLEPKTLSTNPQSTTVATIDGETCTTLLHLLALLERCILYLDFDTLSKNVMELLTLLFQLDASSAASEFVAMNVKLHHKSKNNNSAMKQGLLIQSLLSVVLHALLDEANQDPVDSNANKNNNNSHIGPILDEWSARVLASLLTAKPLLIFRPGSASDELLKRGRTLYGRTVLASFKRVMQSCNKDNTNKGLGGVDLASRMLPLSIQMVQLLSKPDNNRVMQSESAADDTENTSVAETLLVELTQLFRTALPQLLEATSDPIELSRCRKESLDSLGAILRAEYHPCWSVGLKALVIFMQHVMDTEQQHASALFESLLQQRNLVSPGSALQRSVEDALSTLVQGAGMETVWQMIRWQPPGQEQSPGIGVDRAWILGTIKTAALTAQPNAPRLAFFQESILDLARVSDKLAATTKETAFHRAHVIDLWSLLYCFCKGPVDVPTALPPLATILGKALDDTRYPQLVPIISRGLSILCESLSSGRNTADDKTALQQAAQKLLPLLFKKLSSLHDHGNSAARGEGSTNVDSSSKAQKAETASDIGQQTQILSEGIAQLARHAQPQFLHALFKKVMHRLLDEVQSESSNDEKICTFLSLSQALVASEALDENSVSFLYRTLKPFIRNDQTGARCQKKAYKVLAELCERNPSFFVEPERLKEMTELLTVSVGSSQVAARHMRLKCIKHIVDGLNPSQTDCLAQIGTVLAETLLCLKDTNAKTREAAYQLLLAMASKNKLDQFLQTVTAALGAETPHMRSAAVMALSRLVFEFAWEDLTLQSLLPSLLKTVLVLINESSREVIKSVIGFIRISVAAIQREQLEPLLPDLIKSLLGYHKAKDRFRAKIKIILKKLVKQFGYDKLMLFVPESETRLITHMRKLDERQKRKNEVLKDERRPEQEAFDEMVDSDEEDSDDGLTLTTGFTKLTGRTSKRSKTTLGDKRSVSSQTAKKSLASAASSKRGHGPQVLLPNETDGEVVDMLGVNMAKKVKFVDNDIDASDSSDSGGMMEFDDEGRLVIHDDNDDDDGAGKKALKEDATADGCNKKQRISKFESAKVQRSNKNAKSKKQLGAAYKSKKAEGDVKRKNQKYEPYAFVPLDGKSFSKKNRPSAVENMSSVVRQGKKRKHN